ncbi:MULTISPECIES: hypothetical protein [Paraburkholderia]|jgi:hypothetical protein|uniref:Uncharacterized protein n=1 Tax=Paraburkholderia phenazinium TaxID=60549 RepID=A0A1N6EK90_9BURK|nr:hypothetical protein [Paraburkholderia phenazinium]SIN83385.1 hypothetical protein SAMN05444168_0734 [Paraburkholderia phenazinium]
MAKRVRFFPVLPFLMLAFAGTCHADDGVALYSKSTDVASRLSGRWSPDCDNLEGIKIDDQLKAEFTINSNQIVINSMLKEGVKKDGVIDVYFESPLDLGRGGMNLDWGHFSTVTRIAAIKIKGENDISLNWVGFFSNEAKKHQWVNQPDFYNDNGKIDFHRCEN